MRDRRRDPYHRRAVAEGYRARSAYKLAELSDRFRLLREGDYVVDLGAAPGGWLQVVLDRIGARGLAVGVDLEVVRPLPASNAVLLRADVRDPGTKAAVLDRLGRQADVVLSDLSPRLTGVAATDEARAAELAEAILTLLPSILRPGGRFLMKTFMGPGYRTLLEQLRQRFGQVKTTRATATRHGSAELYLAGFSHGGAEVRRTC